MSPKEKAIEIYNKFRNENSVMAVNIRAKKQALICVKEIIDNSPFKDYGFKFDTISSRLEAVESYWFEVKSELEALH